MTSKNRPLLTGVLPGKVTHHPDEPAYGLLVRTGAHNGARRIYTLFARCGIQRGQGVSDVDPTKVARLCGHGSDAAATERVVRATPRVTSADVSIFSERVAREHFSVVNRRWCPECMEEDPYHRAVWDIPYFTACPDHGVRIVEDCGCERRPAWKRSLPDKCVNGHRFDDAARTPAPALEASLSAYVRDRLLGRDRRPSALDDLPTLGAALTVMDRVGQASLGEAKNMNALRRDLGRAGVAAEGFRVLSDFPAGFDDLLDRLLKSSGRRKGPRQWGTVSAYGPFYTWVANLADDGALVVRMKEAIAAHASKHVVLKTGATVAGLVVERQPGIDVVEAAKRTGMTFERFRRVATVMGVLPAKDMKGRPARMKAEDIEGLRGHKTRQQVAAELGIAPCVTGSLIHAGILPAIVDGKADREDRLNIWLLPADAATDLVERLTKGAPADVCELPTLAPLTLAARIARTSLATIIGLILDGDLEVRAVVPGEKGLMGIYVSKSEAKVAKRRKRVPGFTLTEAATEIGVHPETMPLLRRENRIVCVEAGPIWSVSKEEVARFKASYVTTAELSKTMGVAAPQSVPRLLKAVGLEPVCSRPTYRQILYDRKEAEAAVLRHRAEEEARSASVAEIVEGLNGERAASLMRIAPQLLTQLVEAKKVDATATSRGYVVDEAVARAFVRDYASAHELAPLLGAEGAAAVPPVLDRAGVVPFCRRPDFYAFVYPRPAAEAAVKEAAKARLAAATAEVRAATRMSDTLDPVATRERLGVSDTMLKQMRNLGLIASEKFGKEFRYAKDEVARFEKDYVAGGMLRTLCGDRSVGDGNSMTTVLLNAGVKPVCARPAFYNFLFERDAARTAIDAHFLGLDEARASAAIPRTAITLREAQARLGIGTNMGSSLVRAGLLKADVRASTILVEPDEVEGFRASYVVASEIGKTMMTGGNTRAAVALMERLGVPTVQPSRLANKLYDRARVTAALKAWEEDSTLGRPVRHLRDDELLSSDVKVALRCSDTFVREVVAAGLLPARTLGCGRVIMKHDLSEFRRTYALANEFMDAFHCRHPRKVGDALLAMGVEGVKTRIPLSARLFLRAGVDAVLAKRGRQEGGG